MTDSIHWEESSAPLLRQGEILRGCVVPIILNEVTEELQVQKRDLIMVTQSCDLQKAQDLQPVALCPVFSTSEWDKVLPEARVKNQWDNVAKKRRPSIHLLPPLPDDPIRLAVDLRQIYSLTFRYVREHATALGTRLRLKSPYREDFSHDFGAFYSRVAVPRPGDPDWIAVTPPAL